MNPRLLRLVRPASRAMCVASIMGLSACHGSVCVGVDGCFDDSDVPTVTLTGTAATGRAVAGATIRVDCAQGWGSTVSDSAGNYSLTLGATLPCVITAVSGGATLHSLAFAGGTFNTTPETELMMVYLAAQAGTDVPHLVANFPSSGHYQQVLGNATDVLAAETAVVTNLQQRYQVSLAVPSFLTTPFTVSQPGVDTDLAALANAGAIDASGVPDPAAVSLLSQAGAANPL